MRTVRNPLKPSDAKFPIHEPPLRTHVPLPLLFHNEAERVAAGSSTTSQIYPAVRTIDPANQLSGQPMHIKQLSGGIESEREREVMEDSP